MIEHSQNLKSTLFCYSFNLLIHYEQDSSCLESVYIDHGTNYTESMVVFGKFVFKMDSLHRCRPYVEEQKEIRQVDEVKGVTALGWRR